MGGSAVPVLVSSVQRVNVHIADAVNSNSRQKQNNSPSHQPIWACRDWPFMVTRRPGRTSPRVVVFIVITTWNSCHWEQRLASSKIENWFSGKFLWPWKRPRKCTYIQNEMMRWTLKISSSHCLTKLLRVLNLRKTSIIFTVSSLDKTSDISKREQFHISQWHLSGL